MNSFEHWQEAWAWLCHQRKNAPANADIWDLRWRYHDKGAAIYAQVLSGQYHLSPMCIVGRGRQRKVMWCAQDALVLKWASLQLKSLLPAPEGCMHLQGRGVFQSIRDVSLALRHNGYQFVHRTDIRGYYENINKQHVIGQIRWFVSDSVLLSLIRQYVYYSVEDGGEIHTPKKGIPRGCALSPLIGGSLLRHIDACFYTPTHDDKIFYARYMDDFLILTQTRWHLKKHIRHLAEFFATSGFERHPDKTQTGRIENGFDWLGLQFGGNYPTIAPRALANHELKCNEIIKKIRHTNPDDVELQLSLYKQRWSTWANSLLRAAKSGDTCDTYNYPI